jgi:hypothetical protein
MLTAKERKQSNIQLICELTVPVSKLKTKLLDLAKAKTSLDGCFLTILFSAVPI